MGALEYYPARVIEDASVDISLDSLYQLANDIFIDRQNVSIDAQNSLIMEDLYKVGTSAGGQRPKAIIAVDDSTGVVRSGQADLPDNFKYYILKFDIGRKKDFPFTLVEMAYYLMAKDLLALAQQQNIKNASVIIQQVSEVVSNFKSYSSEVGIPDYWADKIDSVLKDLQCK